jgi:transposase
MGTQITGGVDTHLDVHVAAALDERGGVLGTASFATTPDGYRELVEWLCSFGDVVLVGVEGTGSYGAGLTRHLQAVGINVVEVDRPNRQRRRRSGKSDTHDALSAARAAFAGDALGAPKTRDGNVEAIRVLRLARNSATRDRTRTLNQMRSLVTTAPDELRSQLRGLTIPKLLRIAAAFRPAGRTDVTSANRLALKTLARRVLELDDEIRALGAVLTPLVAETAPEMIKRVGVGTDTAGALLVAAGENSSRLHNERSFARLCGVAPLDASSGKQQRHRLSRAGDRQANSALWRIVITRLSYDPDTRRYVQRRCAEGKTKTEAIRCLKRYIARELYACLPQQRLLDST